MIATHKGEIPFVVLLLPFIAGIYAGLHLFIQPLWLLTGLIIVLLIFIFLNVFHRKFEVYKASWLGGLFLHLSLLLFGCWLTISYNELNIDKHFSKQPAQYLVVTINNEPKITGKTLRFTADVIESVFNNKPQRCTGNLLVAVSDTTSKLFYGDELLIPANYRSVEPPFNPAEFNYKGYLANQNIHFQSYISTSQYVLIKNNNGNSIVSYALNLRRRLIEKLKTNMHDAEAIAVASTLILGYKADLSQDTLDAYSKTGTIHVLSVSGAHVAIIYVLLNFLLGFLTRFSYGKVIKAVLIIALIWYYALLSGFSPAVCRAAVMISMVIIGKNFNRYINTLNILAASAFFLLIYNPLYFLDVGFQLSYLAVFGLVVLQPVIYSQITFKRKWVDKLWQLCSVTLAAQIITFPLSVFYFHQFPVYFLLSNLFILIPSAIIMYNGVLYLLLPQIPFVSTFMGFFLEKSILMMNRGLYFMEHAPVSGINKIWVNPFEIILLYVLILSGLYFVHNKKIWLVRLSLYSLLVFSVSISIKRWNCMQGTSIAFLNLKQHSGVIFKYNGEAIVLSDMEAADKTYKFAVQPYLDSCQVGITRNINFESNAETPFLHKHGGLIQYGSKKIMVINPQNGQIQLKKKLKVNYIFITDNPSISLQVLNKNYDYELLILDANNSDDLIKRASAQARSAKVAIKILKRNKALILASN